MDFYDIKRYASIGLILEKAEKRNFDVTAIKINVNVDRTEEISINDLSDDFKEIMRNALKKEQEYIKNSIIQFINVSD
jgi:hypothetical protein